LPLSTSEGNVLGFMRLFCFFWLCVSKKNGGLDGGLFRASAPPADDDRARGCYRSSRRPSRRSSRRFVTVAEACGVRERGCEASRQVLGSGRRMQQPAFLYDGDDDGGGGGGGGPSGGTPTTAPRATHRRRRRRHTSSLRCPRSRPDRTSR
jgi:hypothetical protein